MGKLLYNANVQKMLKKYISLFHVFDVEISYISNRKVQSHARNE